MSDLLGKRVEWTSQSAGSTITKRGTVIYDGPRRSRLPRLFMPPETDHWLSESDYIAFSTCSNSRDKTGYGKSINTGVLVRVPQEGKEPLYYSPRRSGLKVVEGAT